MRGRRRRGLIGLAVLAVLAAPGIAGAATLTTERAAFEAGFSGPLIRETFDADIATADSIRFASGIVAAKSSSGVPPTLNRVRLGDYDGFVVRNGFRTITWDLPTPVLGFGGDFSGAGSRFSSLMVTAFFGGGDSEAFSITDALGGQSGFIGLTSARAFSSLLFSTEAGGLFGGVPVGGQPFSVDNVTLAQAQRPAPAPIPLPAGLPLMLGVLGIGGALGWRQRRARR